MRFFHIFRDKDTLPNNFTFLNGIIISFAQRHRNLCRILLFIVYITNIYKSEYMFWQNNLSDVNHNLTMYLVLFALPI